MDTLNKITQTLDQLIQNEENLQSLRNDLQFVIECSALEKTQESLRAHLFFLGNVFDQTKKRLLRISDIEKKNSIYIKSMHYSRFSKESLGLFAGLFKHNQMRLRKNRLKNSLQRIKLKSM